MNPISKIKPVKQSTARFFCSDPLSFFNKDKLINSRQKGIEGIEGIMERWNSGKMEEWEDGIME